MLRWLIVPLRVCPPFWMGDRPGKWGWCPVLAIEKGFDQGKNRISLFFVESPDFFSWVSRFSFTRGWQVCSAFLSSRLDLLPAWSHSCSFNFRPTLPCSLIPEFSFFVRLLELVHRHFHGSGLWAVPKFIRELGRVSNFNQSIIWHHHIKDHVEIGYLTKFDVFRVKRDQVMDLKIWFKIHTNVSNFETASPKTI